MPLTREQFEKAVVHYGPVLRRILLKLNRGRAADADDLVQRTFQKAWEKREIFYGDEVEPWLRGIARYEHLNHLRRLDQNQRLAAAVGPEMEAEVITKPPPLKEDPAALRECVSRLHPWDQKIVGLFYGRDGIAGEGADDSTAREPMTDREVADALDRDPDEEWSPDRVRTRRHRALKLLRKCLKAKGVME